MKIGMVTSQFGNFLRGGAEIQFDNTVKALKTIEINVQVLNDTLDDIKSYNLIHFFKLDESYLFLTKYLKDNSIPYVISPIFFPESKIIKSWYIFLSYLSYIPGSSILCGVRKIKLLRDAHAIYPNTFEEASIMRQLSHKSNIIVIPNAVEDIYHKSSIDVSTFFKHYPNLENKKFVLCVGRVERRKNQYKLIKACKELNIPVVLIGQIRDKNYWDSCLSIQYNQCYHLGVINDKALLISAYKACEIFALPSTMETPGLAALEAGLQGAKILITKFGGTREYFGESAIYVDPNSEISIKDGLNKLLNKDKNLNEENLSKYSYTNIAKKYLNEYKKIIL